MASEKKEKKSVRAGRDSSESHSAIANHRRMLWMRAGFALAVVIVVAGVGVALIGGSDESSKPVETSGFPDGPSYENVYAIADGSGDELQLAAKDAGCTLRKNRNEGAEHIESGFSYKANPPTSGDHYPAPAEDGAYPPGQAPPTEQLIHSLEHGRVIYQWTDGKITEAQLGSLKRLFDDTPYKLTLTENSTNMPYAIAATAWDRSLTCKTVDEKTLTAFRLFHLKYVDKGPELVP